MNIIDFVKINGHKTFSELAFNEVDSLIFAQLAYLSYKNICTSFSDVIDSKNLNSYETSILLSKKDYGDTKNNERLIREVLSTKRYRGVKIGHYVNQHDFVGQKQFGAVTFIFEEFICISYMGTDDTILGWKEDFSMSYLANVPSQSEGVKYLESIDKMYSNLPIFLTGHSKGGNIAIYALCNSNDGVSKRIIRAYSFDGPGFSKKFIESKLYIEKSSRIEVYIPESSFIGLIMYAGDNYKIIASNKLFMFQHNPYNWLISESGIILKDKLSKKSLAFSESNRKWIENFTDDERKIFFDTIFDLLEYKNNRSFIELKNNWKDEATRIIKNSKDITEENKKLMVDITKNMFSTYIKLLFEKKRY